ncbi:MAG: aminotransferase class I/II-fold pyridoxal phosphate-dependent enzyme [Pseudomonadota bacterium]
MLDHGIAHLAQGGIMSPFTKLNALLADIEPGHTNPILMSVGEPRETMPSFVVDKIAEAQETFAKYPHVSGSPALREAISAWLTRRYDLSSPLDPATQVHPINGSREGLFYAVLPAVGRRTFEAQPAVLIPNPFYQTYAGAAFAAGCEPVYLTSDETTGFLPDLDALENNPALLARAAAFYLCSPGNPQGAIASAAYLKRAIALARAHNFMLFADECYSEIYAGDAPTGALQAADVMGEGLANVVAFNSLSKRSNLPGLRSGFCAGDAAFIAMLMEVRNVVGPQMPLPIQHASAAIWAEEQHVAVNRAAYREKFALCDRLLHGKFGYRRPDGGFFLWLNMSHLGGGEAATVTFWQRCGVKVVPGAYLAQADAEGRNPGDDYVRVALVHEVATIEEALQRIVDVAA